MIARMLSAPCRRTLVVLAAVCLTLGSGLRRHGPEARGPAGPRPGIIDPEQARELDKVTMPRYVVEPPDELEDRDQARATATGISARSPSSRTA